MPIYNQKLIKMVDETIHHFFPEIKHINVEKYDNEIIVEFNDNQNQQFRKNILKNAKSKKLRDIKKALIHELKCFDIIIKNKNEKGSY
jgi:hypothetical protein